MKFQRALCGGLLVAFALAACGAEQTGEPQGADAQVASNGCPATASTNWTADGGAVFTIEAQAAGLDCAQAIATLTMHDASGRTVLAAEYPANEVMTLAGAESVEDMQRRLNEWISPAGAGPDSTGDLPEWAAGADYPMNGEFPFYPEEGLGRAAYEALRARDATMLCYVQGMESLACVTANNGEITSIGVQTFPG